jgi:putative flippase GtrA
MISEILLWKFLKFCIVGSSGMIVDFGTTWVLKERVRINKYIANSTGFILAATSNYLLNRFWTFQSIDTHVGQEYATFVLISLIGLGINNLVIYVLTEKFKLNFYLSKLFAIGTVTLWNFSMNYLVTFR